MSFKTPDILDANEELVRAGKMRVVAPMFQDYGGRHAFGGQIVTVKLFEDNSLVRETLGQDGKGKVLVVDGGGSLRCALLGDLLGALAHKNAWEGIVIYGCVRDSGDLKLIDVGIRALNTHPLRSTRKGVGEANLPVTFGGVTFVPGEWLYADNDGVIVSETALN